LPPAKHVKELFTPNEIQGSQVLYSTVQYSKLTKTLTSRLLTEIIQWTSQHT